MPKKWLLRPSQPKLQSELSQALGIHPIVAQLLINRGIVSVDEAALFLEPKLEGLFDPFVLKDMDKAVARVRLARDRKEKVMVYGDYDVDGVTSTAVMWRALTKFGIEAVKYIPHRMEEGYGLNFEIISLAKEMGISLLITVDCGVNSVAEVEALRQEGIETIVTDHHEPDGKALPAAVAVIDPKREDCPYPGRDLAGVGIAAKFAQALLGEFPVEDLDLITLGTIADVVPLTGENRIFARHGLPMISRTKKAGLRALIASARIQGKEASPHTVGFVLGPRLNAAGRMGSANTSLDLLLAEDDSSSQALACSLEAYNRDRQRLQASVFEEALVLLESDENLSDRKVLVVHGEGWHKGILGIAASKISDKYNRPAIVISLTDGLGVGSARSIEGFHLNEALAHCAELLEAFGGHKRAAGLKLRHDQIDAFREKINLFAVNKISEKPVASLDIDAELPLTQVNLDLVKVISALEPHGEGNPSPLFATRRLLVKGRPQVMGKDTIKFWVTDGRATVSAVGFGMATEFASLRMGHGVDIVYSLGIDDWNKSPQVQLTLKDIRLLNK